MNTEHIEEGHGSSVAEHAQNCSPAPKWAALVDDVAERTNREAALLLVFGSRPSIKTSLLELLAERSTHIAERQ